MCFVSEPELSYRMSKGLSRRILPRATEAYKRAFSISSNEMSKEEADPTGMIESGLNSVRTPCRPDLGRRSRMAGGKSG